jgi:PQQ-dependent catabolism-associated CXXCW motif protein
MFMKRVGLALALLAGLSAAATASGPAHPPEPDGFWTGAMQGAVPATIAGGTVIGTEDLAALVEQGGIVLIDVAPSPRAPEGLAAGTTWLPPPHRSLPGSVWLPDVGLGELPPERDAWFRARLAELTGGRTDTPLVLFCHPNCWGSWNAAKRAILYGYTGVHWYPDGVEGWQDADLPTAVIEAETGPPS